MPKILDADRTFRLPPKATADQVIALAADILAGRHTAGVMLDRPATGCRLLQMRIADRPREVFHVLFLNTRHRLIREESLFLGTINFAHIEPREIVRAALLCNAAAVICGHNHPSGDATPSSADVAITRRIKDALDLVNVRLLDHIVVTRTETVSMAERGLL